MLLSIPPSEPGASPDKASHAPKPSPRIPLISCYQDPQRSNAIIQSQYVHSHHGPFTDCLPSPGGHRITCRKAERGETRPRRSNACSPARRRRGPYPQTIPTEWAFVPSSRGRVGARVSEPRAAYARLEDSARRHVEMFAFSRINLVFIYFIFILSFFFWQKFGAEPSRSESGNGSSSAIAVMVHPPSAPPPSWPPKDSFRDP